MFNEGKRATIEVAENGYIFDYEGRQYLHPDPLKAVSAACESLRISADICESGLVPKLRADAVKLSEENRRLSAENSRLDDNLKTACEDNGLLIKDNLRLKAEVEAVKSVICRFIPVKLKAKKKPSPRKR